jgi:hypothetical protein
LTVNILPYNSSNTAYEIQKEEILNLLKDVPTESIVVLCDKTVNNIRVMRPDIVSSTEGIDTTNNFEEWLSLYADYKYVSVQASSLKDSILNQESSDSFVQLLEYARDHYEDEEYVVITVKDGALNK